MHPAIFGLKDKLKLIAICACRTDMYVISMTGFYDVNKAISHIYKNVTSHHSQTGGEAVVKRPC